MYEEIKTILIAASPIIELRGAIPVALFQYHLNTYQAFFYSVLGNIIPSFFLLIYLEKVSNFLSSKSTTFKKIINWFFERTRKKHSQKFEKSKALALMLFVAIPFPATGAWTGSACAFLFDIPFKQSFPAIFIGVIIAGIIVTLLSLGIINFNNIII
ncbi:MAG TPA: small multi-drug export protein [Candidatus Pacearchaeota archaeon]|nr:small multi-drug export protein [Candidatus Pacearchaeota archaeon]HQM24683.1 small multi-drug export protein [Candidatus Pacearchaeota archaeon]